MRGIHLLRSRNRDLYESLVYALQDHLPGATRLLKYFLGAQEASREPLPARETAVLETLFEQIHLQSDQADYAIRQLTQQVNAHLAKSGERLRLNERAVGGILTTFGLRDHKRTKAGFVLCLDLSGLERIHQLMSTYGIDGPSARLPAPEQRTPCKICESMKLSGKENELDQIGAGDWLPGEVDVRNYMSNRQTIYDVLDPEQLRELQQDEDVRPEEAIGWPPLTFHRGGSVHPAPDGTAGEVPVDLEPTSKDAPVVDKESSPADPQPLGEGTPAKRDHPPQNPETERIGSSQFIEPGDERLFEQIQESIRREENELLPDTEDPKDDRELGDRPEPPEDEWPFGFKP